MDDISLHTQHQHTNNTDITPSFSSSLQHATYASAPSFVLPSTYILYRLHPPDMAQHHISRPECIGSRPSRRTLQITGSYGFLRSIGINNFFFSLSVRYVHTLMIWIRRGLGNNKWQSAKCKVEIDIDITSSI